MYTRGLSVLLIFVLSSCVKTMAPYGNFAGNPVALDEKIARDTIKQMVAIYPPAKTRFDLKQIISDSDAFGTALVNGLRNKGYAVFEFNPGQKKSNKAAIGEQTKGITGIDLRYLLDRHNISDMYHVLVMAGNQSLSRAYIVEKGAIFPAGAWVMKE